MEFEPTRVEHIGLAVQRLNHSATSSVEKLRSNVVSSCIKHVLEPYVQSVVTVWLFMMKSRAATNRTNSAFNSVFRNLWKVVKEVVISMFI